MANFKVLFWVTKTWVRERFFLKQRDYKISYSMARRKVIADAEKQLKLNEMATRSSLWRFSHQQQNRRSMSIEIHNFRPRIALPF